MPEAEAEHKAAEAATMAGLRIKLRSNLLMLLEG